MRNKEGRLVPLEKRAEAIADYLEQEHWQNPVEEGSSRNINQAKLQTLVHKDTQKASFTWEEFFACIKLAKKNKEPGPDNTRMELIIWIDEPNSKKLLETINSWWEQKEAPAELYFARVATIYKKGDTDKAANYRPISLLSSFYKIYMMLIRGRIQEAAEEIISKTQYGFRPAKSTAHAIYIIRRIQAFAESTGDPLFLTLLDWEKAFDKVDHEKLLEALRRLDIHEHVCSCRFSFDFVSSI